MLDRITESHFHPLVGQRRELRLEDGQSLTVCVERVDAQPLAQRPGAPKGARTPFRVDLVGIDPTPLLDGPCAMELPELGWVEGIRIQRVTPWTADPHTPCFQMVFG